MKTTEFMCLLVSTSNEQQARREEQTAQPVRPLGKVKDDKDKFPQFLTLCGTSERLGRLGRCPPREQTVMWSENRAAIGPWNQEL